jgi:hypothetical protein
LTYLSPSNLPEIALDEHEKALDEHEIVLDGHEIALDGHEIALDGHETRYFVVESAVSTAFCIEKEDTDSLQVGAFTHLHAARGPWS